MRHWYFPLILLITCFEREGMREGYMEIFFLWNYCSGGGVSVLFVGINCLHAEIRWALDTKPSLFFFFFLSIFFFFLYEISYIAIFLLGIDKFDFLWTLNCFSLNAMKLNGRRGAESKLTEATGNCLSFRPDDWSLLVDPSSYHPSSYLTATSIRCSELQ